MKRTCLTVIICLYSCGCFLFRSRVAPYPTGIIFPVVAAEEISFEGQVSGTLFQRDGRLYTSTLQGKVSAFDGASRELLWEYDLDAESGTSLISGQEGFYIADNQNSLYSLSAEGELHWKSVIPGLVTGGVCEDEAHVYLGTESGQFLALDRGQGNTVWVYQSREAIHSPPVCAQGHVFFGCDDLTLYCLDPQGKLKGHFLASGPIRGGIAVAGNRLFFGADDAYVYCLNLEEFELRWKVKTGGKVQFTPAVDSRHVFVVSMNNVLTCLHQKSGHVRWWKSLPARTDYRPEIIEDRIVVTTRSRKAVAFDINTGNVRGEYTAKAALRSNPVWVSPYLVVSIQDPVTGQGVLQFLGKQVGATLVASKPSPQVENEEIVITAHVAGFYLPQYEFYIERFLKLRYGFHDFVFLRMDEEKQLVQEESEQSTWRWYPDQEGAYVIEVRVKDEKETASGKRLFFIEKGTTEKKE
jgi:outer membrane protein assembly factor BamB